MVYDNDFVVQMICEAISISHKKQVKVEIKVIRLDHDT